MPVRSPVHKGPSTLVSPQNRSAGCGHDEWFGTAMKDLLRIADLSPEGLEHLLSLSLEAKLIPHHWTGVLEGEAVVLYFGEPSTRTRVSFEAAVARLGGTPIVVGPRDLSLGRGATVGDSARAISRFTKAVLIRTPHDHELRGFASAASVPVINGRTDRHHPTQALADLLTLREHFGTLKGLKVAYVGDGDSIAHSLMEVCGLAGIDIAVATPPEFEPARDVVETAERLAFENGSIAYTTHDPLLAVAGAHAVYTDAWTTATMSRTQRAGRAAAFSPYKITDAVMAEADKDAVFLHCLPAQRGEEVAADIIDGPHSLVLAQTENRLHTAVGLLYGLLRHEIHGEREEDQRRTA
jgi:ornithine carbamoyltransferase